MKTIRFINKDGTQFVSTLRKNVNDYFKTKGISTKGNWNMAIKSIVMLSLYLIPYILILSVSMPGWMIFPLAVTIGLGMAGIGMCVMHDGVHGSYSNKKWLNDMVGRTMYMIGGNVFTWKVQHNLLHHTFTNIKGHDEDIETKAIIRLSYQAPLKKIHRFQHIFAFFFYCLMSIAKLVVDFFQLYKYNKTGITQEQHAKPKLELTKMIITKALYLFLAIGLPIILSSFSWWQILLGFFVMHLTAGGIMSIIFQMAHVVEQAEQPIINKDGNIDNEWAIHELNTTSNFSRNNRFITWIAGGLNFQIEHHLFPNICHVHYKKISPIVEKTVKEFGLKYNLNATFWQAIVSHYKTLKLLGRQTT